MNQKLKETLEKNKEKYIECLKGLVACDTQVIGHGIDGGKEKNGQIFLEKLFKDMGASVSLEPLTEEIIQKGIKEYNEGNPGHNYAERYNLIADFKGCNDKKSLMFDGHVDTMPAGDLKMWSTDPLIPEIKDGKLYGLGACDMKAGLMGSIMAVKLLQDSGIELPCHVKIASVIDEEGGGNGTLAAILNGHKADAAVICEPTENSLIIGHMGFIFFKVEVSGIALHSGNKWKGVNAIEKAIILIDALNELEHKWLMNYRHPFLPSPTLNIGVIEGGTAGSTVPGSCTFKLCLHYLPKVMSYSSVVKEVTDTLLLRSKGDSYLKDHLPVISIYQAGGAFEIDEDNPFVRTAKDSYKDATGEKPQILGATSGNDARIPMNIAHIPTVVMGPGYTIQCHSPNEFVGIQYYLDFILIYAELILNFAKENKEV